MSEAKQKEHVENKEKLICCRCNNNEHRQYDASDSTQSRPEIVHRINKNLFWLYFYT